MLESDYRALRLAMVENQLRNRATEDPKLLAHMEAVPRHCFVPHALRHLAYEDHPLSIGAGQTISQPYMVAFMTALLQLQPTDRVLEIGTGSGYHTAVLAGLCGHVVSIERHPCLSEQARACLTQLQISNVTLHCTDGSLGYAPTAPYDAIVVAAGSPKVPPALTRQLAEGGRLVCPVGDRKRQEHFCIQKQRGELTTTTHTACIFVPLLGKDGW